MIWAMPGDRDPTLRVTGESARPRGLAGLRVIAFESRRAQEIEKLIANYGGKATVAPSMREVPLQDNTEALGFARELVGGGFDMVIFLTGVGTRALARVMDTAFPRDVILAALGRVSVVARGPKPATALQEMGVPIAVLVPEPNTWRDLLHALDRRSKDLPLAGKRVAVQEYGASNEELLAGLAERGARITRVPVYRWALPVDTEPLRRAADAIASGAADLVLFTTSVQVAHLLQIAIEMKLESALRAGLSRAVIGSIGPITSEALGEQGLAVDFEPPHPKMGFLVAEAAKRGAELLVLKRRGQSA